MLGKLLSRFFEPTPQHSASQPSTNSTATSSILDQYVREAPRPQLAVDLFKGEWWSVLPTSIGPLQAGHVPLFADGRITWGNEVLGGFAGKSVLELGPLEGGHTYMIEQAGASSIVSVESNARAYMKCLIVKEIVGLQRARFLYGDFDPYLRDTKDHFDILVASGVLYHMRNPVELIANMARVANKLLLWTHYFDAEKLSAIPHMAHRMKGSLDATHEGFGHTLHRYEYGDFLDTTRFAGGSEHYSNWLSRLDLEKALRFFGFKDIVFGEEDANNPNGPCVLLAATK
jgi:SAM-dependent methyltransferase